MAFHVRDQATDAAVRRLARLTGKTITDTIREAVERRYAELQETPHLFERLRAIQTDFNALKRPGGQPADKCFFDDLWESG
jgi:hypothetical protein